MSTDEKRLIGVQVKSLSILNVDLDVSKSKSNEQFIHEQSIDENRYIVSDVDEEILILIEFERIVDLHLIKVYALVSSEAIIKDRNIDASPPKLIQIYKTDNIDVDFSDISSMKADLSIQCKTKTLNRGQRIKLQKQSNNVIKFKKVRCLVIHVKSNQHDTEQTYLNGIIFVENKSFQKSSQSRTSKQTNQLFSKLKKLQTNELNSKATKFEEQIEEYKAKMTKQMNQRKAQIALGNKIMDTDCDYNRCQSIKKISTVLSRYQIFHQQNNGLNQNEWNEFMEAIFDDIYEPHDLINDFHHLLFDHKNRFEDIHNALVSTCNIQNDCLLAKCIMLRRNYRDRSNDDDEIFKNLSIIENKTIYAKQRILDRIHCYFFHSFHIGHILRKRDQQVLVAAEMKDNHMLEEKTQNSSSVTSVTEDSKIVSTAIDGNIHVFIKNRRKLCENIDGLFRLKSAHARFTTNLDQELIFDHGIRYFYWKYYKESDEINDTVFLLAMDGCLKRNDEAYANEGYSVQDWYIEHKYHNLKDELLNNRICVLSQLQWDSLHLQAQTHVRSCYGKQIRSRGVPQYEMANESPLGIHHAAAMMVYCNYDELQRQFSMTYRRRKHEDDKSLKQRHSNFAHLGRLLREVTECFGHANQNLSFDEINYQILWHGISRKTQFASIKPIVKTPLSTTTEYAVAVNFSREEGLILQLNLNPRWLYYRRIIRYEKSTSAYFDCVWLSDYPSEKEMFFIGGYTFFDIGNIIVQPNINYETYITGIKAILEPIQFCTNLSCARVLGKREKQIGFRVFSNELFKIYPSNKHAYPLESIPPYIDRLFHNYCLSIKRVTFFAFQNSNFFGEMIKVLRAVFFTDDNMINWNTVMMFFPSLDEIWVEYNCNAKETTLDMIQKDDFWSLLALFLATQPRLHRIVVDLVYYKGNENLINSVAEKQATLYRFIGWDIYIVTSERPMCRLQIQPVNKPTKKVGNLTTRKGIKVFSFIYNVCPICLVCG
eukprot:291259_1